MANKGASFERQISTKLSRWWTNGETDAVFWRTSGSGGRATVRGKMGKSTKYSSGDITFTDDVGLPFIDYFLIELKKGYPSTWDILTFVDSNREQTVQKWINKAQEECIRDGRHSWLLVFQRTYYKACVLISKQTLTELKRSHTEPLETPTITLPTTPATLVLQYDAFFNWLQPDFFKEYYEKHKDTVPNGYITQSKVCETHLLKYAEKKLFSEWVELGLFPVISSNSRNYFPPKNISNWCSFIRSTDKKIAYNLLGVPLLVEDEYVIILHSDTNKVALHYYNETHPVLLCDYELGVFTLGPRFIGKKYGYVHKQLYDKLRPTTIVASIPREVEYTYACTLHSASLVIDKKTFPFDTYKINFLQENVKRNYYDFSCQDS
jgi:hypothetical protein